MILKTTPGDVLVISQKTLGNHRVENYKDLVDELVLIQSFGV